MMAASRTERKRAARMPARGEFIGPTPERILKAGGYYTRTPDGYSRVVQATLDRMHLRRQLNPDADINDMLFQAGDRWREDWHESGLGGGSGGVSMDRGHGGTSDPAWSMPKNGYSAEARSDWRAARSAMTAAERIVVGAILLDGYSILDAGRQVTRDMASGRKCREVATELFREGLRSLARHYGMGG